MESRRNQALCNLPSGTSVCLHRSPTLMYVIPILLGLTRCPRMSRAKILDGKWTRKVPWKQNGEWRTDIFKSVLSDPRLTECRFVLKGGPTVAISADELRRVLVGGPATGGKDLGPVNINPVKNIVGGQKVQIRTI